MNKKDLLKRVQGIGAFEHTYDILNFKAVFRTLKGESHLNSVKEITNPNFEDLKERQFELGLVAHSLKKLILPNEQDPAETETIEFSSSQEVAEFLKDCEQLVVDEFVACYADLIRKQNEDLQKNHGTLKSLEMKREAFQQKLNELLGKTEQEEQAKEDSKETEEINS